MTAIFITATGTDIGKTFVTAGLIRHLRAAGHAVEALKPVVSGYVPAEAEGSDPGILLAALGRPVDEAGIERIAPWRFAAPLAPDLAAKRESRTLDFGALLDFSRKAIDAHQGTLLIEGVGGAMAPIDDSHTVLDWMIALKLPLVVVTGSYLGTISHTLTALDTLRRHDLAIKAVVVNETPDGTVTLADTVESLSRFVDGVPIVPLPRLPAGITEHDAFGKIAALL
jgi:dethiobiotin synthetase